MKYVVAVSGGVDSIVLLDMLAKEQKHELIVAHFDHGIRESSAGDARFVGGLARLYGLQYESKREELGKTASEQLAREHRYDFLKGIAVTYNALLVTAHHQDDVIESIAINLHRGTGWRGLAVFGDESINRPLLSLSKHNLISYAVEHNLEWVEDETNATTAYLRNSLRQHLNGASPATKQQLYQLFQRQHELKQAIQAEVSNVAHIRQRYFFIMLPTIVAVELLRTITNQLLLTSQLHQILHMIKTAKPGSSTPAGAGIVVRFTKQEFFVENTGRML